MKALRTLYWLVLLVACLPSMIACTPSMVHEQPPANAVEAVQHSIDELNVSLAAGAKTIATDYSDGTLTFAEFSNIRATLNKVAGHRNLAQQALDAGDPTTADGKLKLAKILLAEAKNRIAELKKETKP